MVNHHFYTNPYKVSRVFNFVKIIGEIVYTVFQHFLVTCTAIYLLDFELVHKWGPPSCLFCLLVFCVAVATYVLLFFADLQVPRL